MTTQELLVSLKDGDEKAYRMLYDRYYSSVCRWAMKWLKSRADALDTVQEIFVSMWMWRSTFAAANNFEAYLYRATKHRCLSQIRRKAPVDSIDEMTWMEPNANNVQSFVEIEHLREALTLVTPKYREVLQMYLDGFNIEEVMEKIGYSQNTVYNYVSLAYGEINNILFSKEKTTVIPKRERPRIKVRIEVPDFVRSAYEYILNIETDESREALLARFNLTRNDEVEFINRYGVTPRLMTIIVLLERARTLLLTTTQTAKEIGQKIGYGSPRAFNVAYKHYFGHAPGFERNRRMVI